MACSHRLSRPALATLLLLTATIAAADADFEQVMLGRRLFFDVNLSRDRSQSCATCHDRAHAFSDGRDNGVGGAVSLGDDARSLGDRNAPSIAYAALVPPFQRDAGGDYRGGLFHDGRALDLVDQVGQPLTNPLEMRMADAAAVVARVRENADYVAALERAFGADVLAQPERAFAAIRASIAAFESTPEFAAFDSRYDRYLAGQEVFSAQEEQGRTLFFSSLTNCTGCHVLNTTAIDRREPFTSQRYFNIGLPANRAVRARNGVAPGHVDRGLRDNPQVADDTQAGKFRVPSLRNVAVTAPYMHNGVFRELSTAVFFYNQYLVDNARAGINPENGRPWGPPEVPANIARDLLRQGQPLDDERIAALVAFLRTLTDRRFEPLLKK